MAISLRCPKCGKCYSLKTTACVCGNDLKKSRKYKASVKLANGKWRTKQVDSYDLARKVEAKYRADTIKETVLGITEAPVIDAVYEKLAEHCRLNTKRPEYYEVFWRIHIKPEFSGRKLDTITPADLDAFHAKLRAKTRKLSPNAKGKKRVPLALSTVSNILKTIKRIYSFADQKGMYQGQNPTKRMTLPRYDNKVTNVLTHEEMGRLLAVLKAWPNRMVALGLQMALMTGKRTGEVFGLTWDRVDFEAWTVTYITKSRVNMLTQSLPMNRSVEAILREAEGLGAEGVDWVFHTATGRAIQYYAIWRRIKAKARLPKEFRPHDLRHTFASYLASSGEVDIYTIQHLLGHRTIQMTQRYSHLSDKRLKDAVGAADKVIQTAL